jgi:hypothetical protein
MSASYQLLIDWQDNGFSGGPDDVTGRTLDQRTAITIKYGHDQSRQFSPISPGELNFEINNISRDYLPDNASSPLAGYVQSGRHVRLIASTPMTSVGLFDGYLDDFDIKPGLNDRSVPMSCVDALGRLKGVSVTTALYKGIRTGTAVGVLLDAAGWSSTARDIDSGASFLPYWWLDDVDAFEALMQLVYSEGAPALVTVDRNGSIVFRDRHHRLTRAASLTSQATWRSSAVEPVLSDPITYDHGWSEIVNSVTTEVPIRAVDSLPSQIWSAPGVLTVPAGTTLQIIVHGSSPFQDAIVPIQDTDYTLVSGDVTPALSQLSGQSTTLALTSTGGAVIQDMQLRATVIQSTSVLVSVEDDASISRYGRRTIDTAQLPVWANAYDVAAILGLLIAKRGDRLPTLQVTMRGAGSPLRLAECLARTLSDRVHLTESLTGLDADCFIEHIAHTVDSGGRQHVTTFGVEKVPPLVTTPFTFGVAGQGFDQGLLGGGGLDNPATMFRFDTAGVGFDQGVFVN